LTAIKLLQQHRTPIIALVYHPFKLGCLKSLILPFILFYFILSIELTFAIWEWENVMLKAELDAKIIKISQSTL